jgi:hypothetical protein
MATPRTKKALVELIQTHLSNNFPSDESSFTNGQVLMYVDAAFAFNLVGQIWQNAKLEGSIDVPEGVLNTYKIGGLAKDVAIGEWFATLPQTPISLPLGYSITEVYFIDSSNGKSQTVFPIENKRVAIREFMAMPTGTRYWVEGNKIVLKASNGASLFGQDLYVRMPKTRTDNISENLNFPEDTIWNVFDAVTKKMSERFAIPQDVINDGLPSGNKAS